jgi:undecaprenyl-diphosphatase
MPSLDFAVFALINADSSAPAWAIRFALFASNVLPALMALSLVAAGVFHRRCRRAFVVALLSLLVVWVVVTVFRSVVVMPRPAYFGLGTQWAPQGVRPGFPSLHTAAAFAFAFSMLFCLPWRAPAYVALGLALVVGWSRVYLGLHFPLDVIAAIALGALVSMVVERHVVWPLRRGARVRRMAARMK